MATLPTYRLFIKSTAEYAAAWLENAFDEDADYKPIQRHNSEYRADLYAQVRDNLNFHRPLPATHRTFDIVCTLVDARSGEHEMSHDSLVSVEFVTLTDGYTEAAIYERRDLPLAREFSRTVRDYLMSRFPNPDDATNLPNVPALPDNLTGQKRQMVELLWQGLTDREIAEQVCLAEHTVANHLSDLRGVFGPGVVPRRRRSHPENRE